MLSLCSLPCVTLPMAQRGVSGHPDTMQEIHSPAAVYLTTLMSGAQGFVLPLELLAALQLSVSIAPAVPMLISISCTDASGTTEKKEERIVSFLRKQEIQSILTNEHIPAGMGGWTKLPHMMMWHSGNENTFLKLFLHLLMVCESVLP